MNRSASKKGSLTRLPLRVYSRVARSVRYAGRRHFQADVEGRRVRFRVDDPYSRKWFFPRYEGGKIHEEAVTKLMVELFRDARCFVDVGAHLGWFTCVAAAHAPADCPVYAFEMDDLAFSLLQRNIALTGRKEVRAVLAAVTDECGLAGYARPAGRTKSGLTLEGSNGARPHEELRTVAAVTLDAVFAARSPRPDVIKVDVEGAEMKVLRGMAALLREERPTVLVEVHPEKLSALGSSVGEVVSFLRSREYELSEVEEHRRHGAGVTLAALGSRLPEANTVLYARPSEPVARG